MSGEEYNKITEINGGVHIRTNNGEAYISYASMYPSIGSYGWLNADFDGDEEYDRDVAGDDVPDLVEVERVGSTPLGKILAFLSTHKTAEMPSQPTDSIAPNPLLERHWSIVARYKTTTDRFWAIVTSTEVYMVRVSEKSDDWVLIADPPRSFGLFYELLVYLRLDPINFLESDSHTT